MQNLSDRATHIEQGARDSAFSVPAHLSRAYDESEDDMPLNRAMEEADDNDLLLPSRKRTIVGEYQSCAHVRAQ